MKHKTIPNNCNPDGQTNNSSQYEACWLQYYFTIFVAFNLFKLLKS
jgi:hypothetical protein